MKLSGSDIIVECLLEQGADTIFGYPEALFSIFTTVCTSTATKSGM